MKKKETKKSLHPRNRHHGRYNFEELIKAHTDLEKFVFTNKYGSQTIDFSQEAGVRALNTALLKHFYRIERWDIPPTYLCPPIPGRADYIHYAADLLADSNNGVIPKGKMVKVLDIGVGANCVYPIIGTEEYQWKFVGSEVDSRAFKGAKAIVTANSRLKDMVDCRFQKSTDDIFKGVVRRDEAFDLTICNPPFHASVKEANASSRRKWKNLGIKKGEKESRNFGGKNTELWYKGGEIAFVNRMIQQSGWMPKKCYWYTTLISKKTNLPLVYKALKRARATDIKQINMAQGQKVSRIIAWTFLTKGERKEWAEGWN